MVNSPGQAVIKRGWSRSPWTIWEMSIAIAMVDSQRAIVDTTWQKES
jgi:hypothetical protein